MVIAIHTVEHLQGIDSLSLSPVNGGSVEAVPTASLDTGDLLYIIIPIFARTAGGWQC